MDFFSDYAEFFGDDEEDPRPPPRPEQPAAAASPPDPSTLSDDEIRECIRQVLDGKYSAYLVSVGQKITSRAAHLGRLILEHGEVTPSMVRRSGDKKEHAWQAKFEMNVVISVTSSKCPETKQELYAWDFDDIRASGRLIKKGDISRNLTSKQAREIKEQCDNTCQFCHAKGSDVLKTQIEHKVPFVIGGNCELEGLTVACAPCNRRKGFFCTKCPNWEHKDPEVCQRCFWASPDDYEHVATVPQKICLESFSGNEADRFDRARGKRSAREALLDDG